MPRNQQSIVPFLEQYLLQHGTITLKQAIVPPTVPVTIDIKGESETFYFVRGVPVGRRVEQFGGTAGLSGLLTINRVAVTTVIAVGTRYTEEIFA